MAWHKMLHTHMFKMRTTIWSTWPLVLIPLYNGPWTCGRLWSQMVTPSIPGKGKPQTESTLGVPSEAVSPQLHPTQYRIVHLERHWRSCQHVSSYHAKWFFSISQKRITNNWCFTGSNINHFIISQGLGRLRWLFQPSVLFEVKRWVKLGDAASWGNATNILGKANREDTNIEMIS